MSVGAARQRRPGARRGGFIARNLPVLFPLPALVLVAGLMLYPLVYTVVLSTRSYDLGFRKLPSFVGFPAYCTRRR